MKHSVWIKLSFSIISIILSGVCLAKSISQQPTSRQDVQQFINEMVQNHNFDRNQLTNWLSQANIEQSIIDAITRPAEKSLPWHRYRKIFITNKRIQRGVEFWQQHNGALQRASAEYGVPEEIIVAILGVETFYGRYAGKHPVLDALVTLAFDYPPRSKFFKRELEEFLLLAREENWDPKSIKGSYAGAMGQPQFISSSYRRYAIDFNQTGQRDLINNTEDSIGSIANYFKVHGWRKNQPIVMPANIQGQQYQSLETSRTSPKPKYSLNQMAKVGVGLSGGIDNNHPINQEKFALISLEGQNGMEHWLGLDNFYVITRYNHSNLYAMAVFELSQEIKAAYNSSKNAS